MNKRRHQFKIKDGMLKWYCSLIGMGGTEPDKGDNKCPGCLRKLKRNNHKK